MQNVPEKIAHVLLDIQAVGFSPDAPVTFKSGIKSPVYIDNRRLPYWPEQWQTVISAFQFIIGISGIPFDVIAGIEAAGIPHSAALGYSMRRPSIFVRKQAKAHGTQSRIEGGSVEGKRVLLIEDLVTTGGSSLSGVAALRAEGARVEDCLAIVSYGFTEAIDAFTESDVRLQTLTNFSTVVRVAAERQAFDPDQHSTIQDWLNDPHGWGDRHGFKT